MDIADLRVVVGADTSGAEKGLASLSTKVESFGSTFARTFTLAATAGVAALAVGFGASVKEAATFEKTISGVMAVGGKEAQGMRKELEALALQLGADTSFSAKEAAEGIEELVKAGVSLGDVMGGATKASLDLAAAGGISVADAATIASNAMNQFNIKGSEMGRIADTIAGAANASAIDVGQFKFSLQAAGAVAATVGFSFDDLAQAIAVMGQAGITGSDAGTSLKTMMMGLQPQTKEQTKLFKDLGLITKSGSNAFFDATGKVKSMAQVAQVLQNALKGQTEQQKLATLQTLFGSDAIRAAAVLAKAGAEGFEEMAEAMGKVSAADVAEQRLNNLSGSLEKLQGSLSTVAITIGLALTPVLKKLVDWATDLLNAWMPTIQAFAERLPGAIDATGNALSGFVKYLGAVLDEGDTWNDWLTHVPESLRGVTEALGDLIVWVARTVAEVVGIETADMTRPWEQLSGAAEIAAGNLRYTFGQALSWLSTTGLPLLSGALAIVTSYATGVFIPMLTTAWTWLAPNLQAALGWLASIGFPMLLVAVQATGVWLQTTGIPILTSVWDWLGNKLGAALTWLTATGWPLLTAAATATVTWFSTVAVPALMGLWNWLAPQLQAALTWLTSIGWPAMGNAANAVQNWISETLMPTLRALWDWLSPKLQDALTWLTATGWPLLQTAGAAVWSWLTATLFPALSEWWEWLQDRLSPVYTWFITHGWPSLQSAGATVLTWLTSSLFPALSEWWDWLQERLAPVYTWFITYAWPTIQSAAAQVESWLTSTLFPTLRGWWEWLQDRLSPVYTWFIDYGWPKFLGKAIELRSWLESDLFPTLRELWVWFQERLAPVLTWHIDHAWPKLYAAVEAYYDLIGPGRMIKSLKGLYEELKRTDAGESWVTIFENLSRFGKFLIENIDLGGWFRKIGGGAGEAGEQVGFVAQAIAWISRTLAKWSSFLPGANKVPPVDDVPKAPGGGGGSSGGSGGGTTKVGELPGRSTGGGGGSGGGGSPPPPGGGGGGGGPTAPPPPPPPPPNPPPGDGGGTSPVGDNFNMSSRSAMIASAKAIAASANIGLPGDILAAIPIQEAGFPGTDLGRKYHNWYSIKATPDWKGPTVNLGKVWEIINGQKVWVDAVWRVYPSDKAAMIGFRDFLDENSRYRSAMSYLRGGGDPVTWIKMVNQAGYATDPTWWQKVANIAGYASGGWAGLHGPELAVLGERGPEYVVPHHLLGSSGGLGLVETHHFVIQDPSGRTLEEWYVIGRDMAIRRGRVPSGAN